MSMNGEWCYFDSVFSKQECEDILKSTESVIGQKAALGVEGTVRDEETRRSTIKFLHNKDSRFQHIFDKLWKLAIEANDDFFRFHITRLDYLQLAEYTAEERGEYKNHHDVFWINNDPIYHRKLSAIIQLTDPDEYEGGDFRLVDVQEQPDAKAIRKQGTVIFFPSFFTHRAEPVTKGTRHSIAAWMDGPKWR